MTEEEVVEISISDQKTLDAAYEKLGKFLTFDDPADNLKALKLLVEEQVRILYRKGYFDEIINKK